MMINRCNTKQYGDWDTIFNMWYDEILMNDCGFCSIGIPLDNWLLMTIERHDAIPSNYINCDKIDIKCTTYDVVVAHWIK